MRQFPRRHERIETVCVPSWRWRASGMSTSAAWNEASETTTGWSSMVASIAPASRLNRARRHQAGACERQSQPGIDFRRGAIGAGSQVLQVPVSFPDKLVGGDWGKSRRRGRHAARAAKAPNSVIERRGRAVFAQQGATGGRASAEVRARDQAPLKESAPSRAIRRGPAPPRLWCTSPAAPRPVLLSLPRLGRAPSEMRGPDRLGRSPAAIMASRQDRPRKVRPRRDLRRGHRVTGVPPSRRSGDDIEKGGAARRVHAFEERQVICAPAAGNGSNSASRITALGFAPRAAFDPTARSET